MDFLREPNVTVGAADGNLVLDILLLLYARQTPDIAGISESDQRLGMRPDAGAPGKWRVDAGASGRLWLAVRAGSTLCGVSEPTMLGTAGVEHRVGTAVFSDL